MSDSTSRLPNLYQLLGLAPLESDRAKIAAAIQRMQNRESEETAAGSEELQRREKIVALAQKYLLDPQRKAAYDQQWRTVYQPHPNSLQQASAPLKAAPVSAAPLNAPAVKAPAVKALTEKSTASATSSKRSATTTATAATVPVAAAAKPSWDYSRLEQLLPQGDPEAPFDMASFLRSGGESRDPMAAEADLAKLIALLSGTGASSDNSSATASPLASPTAVGSEGDSPAGEPLGLASARGGQPHAASGGLARRLRQRKQRALVIGGTALAAGLGGLVLLGLFLFGPKPEGDATQLARVEPNRPAPVRGSGLPKIDLAAAPTAAQPQADAPPVGSGLPKPGEGAMNLEIEATVQAAQPTESMPAPEPKSNSEPQPEPNMNASAPAQPASSVPSAEPESQPGPKPESEPQPPPAPATEPELTKEEKRTWQKAMTKAKELIGEHNFEEVEKQLVELKAAAKTSVQRGQLERLEQVNGLVKDVRQAMVDAIAGLGPADTFKAGTSTIASFVEGDEERITVRVSGRNISARLEDVPVGLGLGLVDLKLDVEHASSLARKGAYILTHPSAKAAHERGKQMLQAAADAGAITPELAQFYEDDYSLPEETN